MGDNRSGSEESLGRRGEAIPTSASNFQVLRPRAGRSPGPGVSTETAERETGVQGADESQAALMARGKTTALSRELRYCRHVGRQCLHKPRAAFSCLLLYFCN